MAFSFKGEKVNGNLAKTNFNPLFIELYRPGNQFDVGLGFFLKDAKSFLIDEWVFICFGELVGELTGHCVE